MEAAKKVIFLVVRPLKEVQITTKALVVGPLKNNFFAASLSIVLYSIFCH